MRALSTLGLSVTMMTAVLFNARHADAASFTAVISGNWSSSATWGGTAPSFNIISDQIIIPSGVTVTMDGDVTISGLLAIMTVNGSLSGTANNTLTVSAGTVNGSGSINVDDLNLQGSAVLNFSGSLTANTMSSAVSHLSASADFMVNQTMTLASGVLSLNVGSSLDVANNATIAVSGGSIDLNGGTIGLSGNYNVVYTSGSAVAGAELTGPGLMNVTINVGAGEGVTLTSDLTIDGTLTLTSGTLELNGNDLTISVSGDVSASGSGTIHAIFGTSNITVNASGGVSGSLSFSGNSSVNDFTVNVGTGNDVQISGNLTVDGTLNLTSGSLNFGSASLTIDGGVSGSGTLLGNAAADLTVSTSGGLAGGISFGTGGQVVNDFDVSVGFGNTVALNSDLTITGTLDISGGSTLDISGVSVTVATSGDITGLGSLVVDAGTDLYINATGGVSADLDLVGGILGDLTINVGSGSSVNLGGDLTVNGTLSLESGTLDLNGFNLTIAGNIAASGSGNLSSSLLSDITVSTATSPSGSLSFSASGAVVGDFTVNIGSSGSVSLGSDLEIEGTLNFVSGSVSAGSFTVSIAAGGSISGADSSSYVIIGSGGSLAMSLFAGTSAEFPVGTSIHFSPAVIELNPGSASGTIEVGVAANVLAQGTAGIDLSASEPMVDVTWFISSDISANLDMDMEVMWSADMEVNGFVNTAAYISHFFSGSWDVTATASATAQANGMFSLRREGVTSLSPFAVFDQNTETAVRELTELNFEVYPNPASQVLTVSASALSSDALYVEVLNTIGTVVASYVMVGSSTNIPVENLGSGNYFIRISTDDGAAAVKRFTKI